MYRQFYGLVKKPFELVPDPKMFFLSETHKEALAVLRYGVVSDKSFLLLTGGVGTGKTTLIQTLVTLLSKPVRLCLISNPTMDKDEFFYYLASQLKLPYDGNKAKLMVYLSKLLELCHKKKEKVLLIFDEAHVIPVDLLEEIRLLSNQTGKFRNVLSIFLIGQPEMLKRLGTERLQPLKQRIGIRFHVESFTDKETVQYILSRLKKAGARRDTIFTEKAIDLIHKATNGNPRLINILSDHCLLSGYSSEQQSINEKIVRECAGELNVPGEELTFQVPSDGIGSSGSKWLIGLLAVLVVAGGLIGVAYYMGWLASLLQ